MLGQTFLQKLISVYPNLKKLALRSIGWRWGRCEKKLTASILKQILKGSAKMESLQRTAVFRFIQFDCRKFGFFEILPEEFQIFITDEFKKKLIVILAMFWGFKRLMLAIDWSFKERVRNHFKFCRSKIRSKNKFFCMNSFVKYKRALHQFQT